MAAAVREEERRVAAAEERKKDVNLLWMAFDQQAANCMGRQGCAPLWCWKPATLRAGGGDPVCPGLQPVSMVLQCPLLGLMLAPLL